MLGAELDDGGRLRATETLRWRPHFTGDCVRPRIPREGCKLLQKVQNLQQRGVMFRDGVDTGTRLRNGCWRQARPPLYNNRGFVVLPPVVRRPPRPISDFRRPGTGTSISGSCMHDLPLLSSSCLGSIWPRSSLDLAHRLASFQHECTLNIRVKDVAPSSFLVSITSPSFRIASLCHLCFSQAEAPALFFVACHLLAHGGHVPLRLGRRRGLQSGTCAARPSRDLSTRTHTSANLARCEFRLRTCYEFN